MPQCCLVFSVLFIGFLSSGKLVSRARLDRNECLDDKAWYISFISLRVERSAKFNLHTASCKFSVFFAFRFDGGSCHLVSLQAPTPF